ncbi:DNA-methyltransferase [Mycoplasma enhydrae]|uniref:DNA-methyltransferase n=1 Tax=Mycoplasma enhydrae TaxID=2499220 RepID=UPI00197B5AEC|nr:site-specific DNA-methyltransferase [Mycoplasma enhydrae]MBN4089470.1 site-specific DNA-methyltransferase [Mycoplasma enhydrae]
MNIKNSIIKGDAIEELSKIPSETFDFCFSDPPYFLQIDNNKELYRVEGSKYNGCDDDWDKFSSMEEYKKWTHLWLSEVKRVLKPNGTVCVISGMQSIYEIGSILKDLGFWIINDIIWQKTNPTPNFLGTRLNNSHETIIWAAKSKKAKFTFNYKTGKFLNDGKQMGSVWKIPICSGKERLKDENNIKVHTTQKPKKLIDRIIYLFTKQGDWILDPFGGTMTTGVSAKEAGRNYTLIERELKYIKYGQKRLDETKPNIGDIQKGVYDIKPARIKIEDLVKEGYLKLNEFFIHKNGEQARLVNTKGQLEYNGNINSMHDIASAMMNRKNRVNAYDYLFVNRNGNNVSISDIREKYRLDHNLPLKVDF